ncbi:IS1182 family transposase [Pontibacter chinhatensis]|uniref:Transposase n=1 Tax=Pontibacter chinhatensis TaxID=1436961 RepID=A0A1I2VCG6_9BACT|nr:IS1182 family transposase [Pontibacter chinhatensis]SFG86922.1 Transposase [Pontibacter chinhatensis]
MKFKQAYSRDEPPGGGASLEELIAPDNEVRFIDAFVDSLPLEKLGFRTDFPENGRPAYHPTVLLKLLVYGYLNRIRSSRCLERECGRNLEVMWLLGQLAPDHNTIANFRKNNARAITRVFRATVKLARHFDLVGGELLAGDSTKLRAQNSKKNNFNRGKIARHLAYIEDRLTDCQLGLGQTGEASQVECLLDAIARHALRREYYLQLLQQLQDSGEDQVSISDPESRQMIIRNTITEVAYSVQATVDAKYCLLIDYQVTNHNDTKAMGNMLRRAKSIVGNSSFTALFDKGYYTGSELEVAQKLGVTALVAIPAPAASAPDPAYNLEHFVYDSTTNTYTCPEGHTLTTNGHVYTKNLNRSHPTHFYQYRTKACKTCEARARCTTAKNGKLIERNTYTPLFEENRQRIAANPELYRRRQAIVEHPFGTIKRQWGYSYVLTKKGIERASADVGLMLVAYNLRRIFNTIGLERLRAYWAASLGMLSTLNAMFRTQWPSFGQRIKCHTLRTIYLQITIFN